MTPSPLRSRLRSLPISVYVVSTTLAVVAAGLVLVLRGGGDDDRRQVVRLDPDSTIEVDDDVTPAEQMAGALGVEFINYDGATGTLGEFAGTPLVVNFFSITCVPCVTEMPEFEEVSQEFGTRVKFVGLAVLDRPEEALGLVEDTGVTYFTARDPKGDVYSAMHAIGMPTTVLIDASGTIVDRHTGRLSAGDLRDLIDSELLS